MTCRIAIAGAAGRMGRRLLAASSADPGLRLVGALERPGAPELGADAGLLAGEAACGIRLTDRPDRALAEADVLVEFAGGEAAGDLAAAAVRHGVALVSGSTGLPVAAEQALLRAAEAIPLLRAPNFSLGMVVLRALARQAVAALGPAYDLEVLELHHRGKRDAPSGSALALARAAAGDDAPLRLAREGLSGGRPPGEVGVLALRGGDAVGEHTLLLLGEGERLELTHRASSREIFVQGALRAACWLAGRAPGRYTLEQVLGLG
ncbi:MAG: 4-hydroxy-tetrahydrodipicolinate reductase [Myxococcota bacterium]|jgi:4-hydroxy-tetrahydrodipicolinate reductase|nr:4-hydroxy-tetrahydrodipicolinate reductase [Myxococcota bacterium]